MPFVENERIPLSKPGYWVELREFGYLDDQKLNLRLAQNFNVGDVQGDFSTLSVEQIPLIAVYCETLAQFIAAWNIDDANGILPITEETVRYLGRDQGKVLWHILKNTPSRKLLRDLESLLNDTESERTVIEVAVSDEDFFEPPTGISPETIKATSATALHSNAY